MPTTSAERRSQARTMVAEAMQMAQGGLDTNSWNQALHRLQEAARLDDGYFEPHFHLACASQMLGELPDSKKHFQATLARDPRLGGDAGMALYCFNSLGELYEMEGAMVEATRAYNRFLGLFPMAPEGMAVAQRLSLVALCCGDWLELYQTAWQYEQAGEHEAAVERLRRAIELYPDAAFLHCALGVARRGLGLFEEAVQAFERAIMLDPDSRTCVEMGRSYADEGNPYVEESLYRRAIDINGLDAEAWFHLGSALYVRRERDGALTALRRAMELAPEAEWAPTARRSISEILGSGHIEMPACLSEPVQWEKWTDTARGLALSCPAGAEITAPGPAGELLRITDRGERPTFTISLRRHLAEEEAGVQGLCRRLERHWLETGRFQVIARSRIGATNQEGVGAVVEAKDAQADVVLLLVIQPRGLEIFELSVHVPASVYNAARQTFQVLLRGLTLMPQKELQQRAVTDARAQLRRPDLDTTARSRLGYVLLENGDVAGAESVYARLLQEDPNGARANAGMGLVAWKQGKLDLAIKSLEKAVTLPSLEVHKRLGEAWEQKGQPDKALKAYLRALELDPQDVWLLQHAGRAYEGLKRTDHAEQAYRQVLAVDARHIGARVLLANVFRKTRRLNEAIALLQEAATLDPVDPTAFLHLAVCYMELRQWDPARDALRKAQMQDPMNSQLRQLMQELEKRAPAK